MKRTICIFLATLLSVAVWADANLGLKTVVIDPGHGGKDAGCISADKKTFEKNLALDIAKTLSSKIKAAYPDVKVILTRSTDEYITLHERAVRANKSNANLFISIHINASVKTSPNGYSIHILGQSSQKNRDLFAYNMDVCKRENSVIMLEDDYSTKYQGFDPNDPESLIFMQLMQNAYLEQSLRFAQVIENNLKGGPIAADRGIWQNPFWVLWETSMPAVLVELGFISNQGDLEVLRQQTKREEIAERLFKAFKEYKVIYDRSVDAGTAPKNQIASNQSVKPVAKPQPKVEEKPAEPKKAVVLKEAIKPQQKNESKPAASQQPTAAKPQPATAEPKKAAQPQLASNQPVKSQTTPAVPKETAKPVVEQKPEVKPQSPAVQPKETQKLVVEQKPATQPKEPEKTQLASNQPVKPQTTPAAPKETAKPVVEQKPATAQPKEIPKPVVEQKPATAQPEETPKPTVEPKPAVQPKPEVKPQPAAVQPKETPKPTVEQKPAAQPKEPEKNQLASNQPVKPQTMPAAPKETAKPVVEQKPATAQPKETPKPVAEQKPATEQKPVVEQKPEVEQKPTLKPKPAAIVPREPEKTQLASNQPVKPQTMPAAPKETAKPTVEQTQVAEPKPADNPQPATQPKEEATQQPAAPKAPQVADIALSIDSNESESFFAVQIMAVSRDIDPKDPIFLGYTPKVIKTGNLRRYYISISESKQEVARNLPDIQKTYPDAFIVEIEHIKGKVVGDAK